MRVLVRATVAGVLVDLNLLVWKIVIDDLNEAFFVGIPEDA